MEKISIIVPVYNSESFLRRCLDSIVRQTHTNLEIICIDDGSSDSSVEICDEYASRDNRFRVFRKETKGGSGNPCRSANIGLKHFTGNYVGYVETDDWIEPDMYEILYKTVKDKDVSIGVVNYFTNGIPRKNAKLVPSDVLSSEDMLRINFDNKNYLAFHWLQWNKLYSADIIKNNDILFDTKFLLGYDPVFSTRIYLCEGCTGAYNNTPLYHYTAHGSSISMSPTNMIKKSRDSLEALKECIRLLENSAYKNIIPLANKICVDFAFWYAWECLKAGESELQKKAINEMKNYDLDLKYINGINLLDKIFLPKNEYYKISNKNILLFGSGNIGQISKKILEASGIAVKHYIDNDVTKHGHYIDDTKIIALEEAIKIANSVFIIGVYPGLAVLSIFEQLKEAGVCEEHIFYLYC